MTDEEMQTLAQIVVHASTAAMLCATEMSRKGLLSDAGRHALSMALQGIADILDRTEEHDMLPAAAQYHLAAREIRNSRTDSQG